MSSLYGAGGANAQIASTASVANVRTAAVEQATTTEQVRLTDQQDIENYVKRAYADHPILVEIAWCESRFKQFNDDGTVVRGKVNNQDVGVMQINEHFNGDEAKKLGYDIYDVKGNVAFGEYLYGRYGTDPWNSSEKCWGQTNDIAKK
ncbi:MAG: transglycosylase SLT domain-containing protein [Patescibacteria group bacterium]|nr:transglycosylase SLT domain-containing protein [Patescibacteria group bacterium]